MPSLSEYIKQECLQQGFFDCSISTASALSHEKESYTKWIAEGKHGKMSYLAKHTEMRFDPRLLMPGTKSIVSVLLNYYPQEKMPFSNNYRIAKYAYGQDYHQIVKDKLNRVAEACITQYGSFKYRAFTDSAPILDRVWAQKGGLGWIGKNTLLINKTQGSFFIIGHLFMDKELIADQRFQEDLCLDCDKCISACPTRALEPYTLDARKCLSYQTIENKSPEKDIAPRDFRNWIFGCDICQDVCPFNSNPEPHSTPEFHPHPQLFQLKKADWQALQPMVFGEIFRGTAVKRTGYKGLMQNINWIEEKQS